MFLQEEMVPGIHYQGVVMVANTIVAVKRLLNANMDMEGSGSRAGRGGFV